MQVIFARTAVAASTSAAAVAASSSFSSSAASCSSSALCVRRADLSRNHGLVFSPLSARAASSSASALVSRPVAAAAVGRRPALAASPRHALLLSASYARHRPALVAAASVGATRSLSLWPFSRSSSNNNPAASAEPAVGQVAQAGEQVQQVAQQAKESISASASNAASSVSSTSAADVSSKTAEIAHNVSEGVVDSAEAVGQLVTTVASGGTLPHTPSFVELGLGQSWWPPTAWLQTFLDYLTTTTGLPWWATIIGTTVVLRFALAPLLIYVQGNTIRLANIQPNLQNIMEDIQHAKATGDMAMLQSNAQRAQALFRENNCHPARSFLLPLVQMPIFVSFFFALRGMADAGLPSLKDGGLAWFTDLSAADPYYVLPIASAAATLLVLETGAETGTNTAMPQMKTMKNFLRVVLVIATWFILEFPAAVLLYWVTNNSFSLLQLLALRTSFLRNRLGLPERLVHAAPKPATLTAGAGGYRAAPVAATKDVGFWEGIKQGMDTVNAADAHTRARAPTALRRSTADSSSGGGAGQSAAALARDRALKALYDQSRAAGAPATTPAEAASGSGGPTTTSAGLAGLSQGQVTKAAAMEERATRIQNARQRRAARSRV